MKLYELPERYRLWMNKVEDNDGEINQELAADLALIDADLATKADAYCALALQFKHEEAAFREEARRMQAKAQVAENKQERLRALLLEAMKAMDVDTIRGRRFFVRRQVSTTPSIRWESNERIPECYRKVVESLNYDAVLQEYREGCDLPEGMKVALKEFVTIR